MYYDDNDGWLVKSSPSNGNSLTDLQSALTLAPWQQFSEFKLAVYLSTADPSVTPFISNITITVSAKKHFELMPFVDYEIERIPEISKMAILNKTGRRAKLVIVHI